MFVKHKIFNFKNNKISKMENNNLFKKEIDNIKDMIKHNNVDFFKKRIINYEKIKLFHMSILGYAIYFADFTTCKEICKEIILNNKLAIQKMEEENFLEEDGYKTLFYLFDTDKLSTKDKKELISLYVSSVLKNKNMEDYFEEMSFNFEGQLIAKNKIELLFYFYENFKQNGWGELKDFYYDIKDKLLSDNNFTLLDYFEKQIER